MSPIAPESRRSREPQPKTPDISEKRIVYQNGESVAVLIPAVGITLEEVLLSVPEDVMMLVVDASEIPSDRTFRMAWALRHGDSSLSSACLGVDMIRAREIWRQGVRERRKDMLARLDVEYQRADEAGNAEEKARIAERKNVLRDAPADPRIEQAETPEDLKNVDPLA
jgi:hypothetical protein